jgi:hypothetical protein
LGNSSAVSEFGSSGVYVGCVVVSNATMPALGSANAYRAAAARQMTFKIAKRVLGRQLLLVDLRGVFEKPALHVVVCHLIHAQRAERRDEVVAKNLLPLAPARCTPMHYESESF